jgi:hypothetical protein
MAAAVQERGLPGMKCKHLNGVLTEEVAAVSVWYLVNGKPIDEGHSEGDYTGAFSVKCDDCGMCRRFPGRANLPQWAERLRQAVNDYACSEFELR